MSTSVNLVAAGTPPLMASGGPNCWQCRHFGVSYEAHMPYLCRLMGIKTRALPALEVWRADGRYCQGFVPKPTPAAGRGGAPS